MCHVVIRRCPVCPTIGSHALGVEAAIRRELDFFTEVTDGATGEFTVLVDGHEVYRKDGDSLPPAADVVEAVRGMALACHP